jgi:putative transposase
VALEWCCQVPRVSIGAIVDSWGDGAKALTEPLGRMVATGGRASDRLTIGHQPTAPPIKSTNSATRRAFIVMKAADEFRDKTTAPNQLWQTDFPYLKVIGWGWFYLSTILDDFSRFIVAWKLCTTMEAADVTETVGMALAASGLDGSRHRPRLLSDNVSSYVTGDLATWLGQQNIKHVRGAPSHPMTQGKIVRWHQTMKNRILLENDFLPGDLEAKIGAFVDHYNHRRYHESIGNLTPEDVYTGRGQAILERRDAIERRTIEHRRLLHQQATA